MDKKKIEFSDLEGPSINVIMGTTYSETPSSSGPRPIIIFHENETARTEVPKVPIPILVVEVPKAFLYESDKAIPWDYNCNYIHQIVVNDLTGVRGITQSGRCYAPSLAETIAPEQISMPISEEKG